MDTLPFLRRIAAPRLDVVPELAPSLPSIVADRTQFQQVLMNIVLNAVEAASGPGAVRITTAGPIEQPARGEGGEGYNHFIVIRITDNGKGMTPDVVEKIFDPFFTTKETGRGLGMSAVLGIVTSHGGTIHVESEPGKGTSVEILWPVQTRGEHEEKMEETLANPGGETVLVVDDEEIVRDVAAEILEGFGYRVVVATDGDESIDMVRKNSAIRLVLLDVLMERMDGLEAYTLLKEINPDLKVLVTSGYDADGPVKEIMQKGADGFIHKPFQIDELRGAVGRIIRPAGAEGADARPQN
jgi:CheY-like chemotaxis protein